METKSTSDAISIFELRKATNNLISKEIIENRLENYAKLKRRLSMLLYDIENFSGITPDEMIEAMALPINLEERVSTSEISDRTSKVALSYKNILSKSNAEAINGLYIEYQNIRLGLEMLEKCISSLSGQMPGIIRDTCINKMTRKDLCDKYSMAYPTIQRFKSDAIEELYDMLNSMLSSDFRFWKAQNI